MSKWDYLDEEYEEMESFTPIRKNMDPEGSLTDHYRLGAPRKNAAHKRNREFTRRMKEYL
jgi:hypothetical protein